VPVYRLGAEPVFPPVDHAEDGLLAVGGDLSPNRLLRAYSEGIFPWYSEGEPILWHSPDPRFVLTTGTFRVPKRVGRAVRSGRFRVTLDEAFADVIGACQNAPRPGHPGTWITEEMKKAYVDLHRLGFAHSAEAWQGEDLVGGLYGVSIGGAFFGESMFAHADDASKVAFVTLAEQLEAWDIHLIDCQVETPLLAQFGARNIPRDRFIELLGPALERPTRRGRWRIEG
jgi:leucyl/phenylalanyl-tRNA--protein transferase